MRFHRAAAAALLFLLLAGPAAAQPSPPGAGWDSARVLELMELARARRLLPAQDTTLRNYSARAEGFVYFYLDRRDIDERTLVKVDQVALEVFWAPPNQTRQRIVGLRDVSRLPNRMQYHLDHLTVVQDGFGDVIRMGDGDEVSDVPHPAAPGSDSIYHFRLADSLTLQLPGAAQPIRVYEVQVRPRRTDRSALVGSLFVDRARGDVVRMTFTFTPASYVDRRLDYINVSLDNGLWEGRYWLPHEQTLLIRRQVPELDFAAGAVIQGRMRVSEYVFNDEIPARTFYGHPVTAVPPRERESFDFERGIYDDLNDAGLAPPPDLSDIRRQAAALLGPSRLSGLPRWRLSLGSASSAFRYNRAEGAAVGLGVAWAPGAPWRADAHAGYAFGPERPWATVAVRRELSPGTDLALGMVFREPQDLGPRPGMPRLINTVTALVAADDYLDPWYATGARLTLRAPAGPRWSASIGVAAEEHRSASLTQETAPLGGSADFRPVLPVDEGRLYGLRLGIRRAMPDPRSDAWGAEVDVEAGFHGGSGFVRPTLTAALRRASADHRRSVLVSGGAGFVSDGAPAQRAFLMGGANTLPGYDYREFAGTAYGLLRAEATAAVLGPWLGVRMIGAAGVTGGPAAPAGSARAGWPTRTTGGIRTAAGAGISLFWDLLQVDAVRGLDGGSWRLQFSFHRDFWDIS